MRRLFKGLRPEFLHCRTKGHQWEDVSGIAPWQHKVEYLRGDRETVQRLSCTTEREVIFSSATGEVMARRYRYPDGYALAGVELPEGTTLREAMRYEWGVRSRAGQIKRRRAVAIAEAKATPGRRRKAS